MAEANVQEDGVIVPEKVEQTGKTNADNLEAALTGGTVTEPDLPAKFKGKSAQDIAKMYLDLEKDYSRKGSELSEYQKLVKDLTSLEHVRKAETKPESPPVTTDDLFADPEKAIHRAVEKSPVVEELKQTREQLEAERRALSQKKFVQEFPNYRNDLENPEFVEWVQSSRVRVGLAQEADNYNAEAAIELWNMWKERQDLVNERKQAKETKVRQAEKAGTLESGTGTQTEAKARYSRAQIRELKYRAELGDPKAKAIVENPDWKRAVMEAYAEGRAE